MNIINANDRKDPKLYLRPLIFFSKKLDARQETKYNSMFFGKWSKVAVAFFQSPVITNQKKIICEFKLKY